MPNLEQEIIDVMARDLARDIDTGILASVFNESGWVSVVVDPWVHGSQTEINEWCDAHFEDGYFQNGNVWLFKEPKDATMFTLRWS
jgi:hypothetical protein